MDKTFIIEYVAGCKGDFLTNFLNGERVEFRKHNKSFCTTAKLFTKSISNITGKPYIAFNNQSLNRQEILQFLDNSKNFLFCNCHEINFHSNTFYKNEFKKRNIRVKKILFSKKYYRTIMIEHLVKNHKNVFEYLHKNQELKGNNFFKIFCEKIEELKYFDYFNKFKKNHEDKDLLYYDDLFINFSCKDNDIAEKISNENFKNLVNQSWLPDNVELFGINLNLKQLGYRDF